MNIIKLILFTNSLFVFNSCSNSSGEPTLAQRISVAQETARENLYCQLLGDFYWVIGDKSGPIIDSSEGDGSILATTNLSIASASKLIFSTYVIEKINGQLTEEIIKGLNFTSGYTNANYCQSDETISECYERGTNSEYALEQDGRFYYGPGHMLRIANNDLNLSTYTGSQIANEIEATLGDFLSLAMTTPTLASGMQSNALSYGLMLQKIVNNDFKMKNFLGYRSVCATPSHCPSDATTTPIPMTEIWYYSMGHWVETDPVVGDGAYSSTGAFGFYPWIDATKAYWGLISRYSEKEGAYYESVQCGRLIRRAFFTGQAQ